MNSFFAKLSTLKSKFSKKKIFLIALLLILVFVGRNGYALYQSKKLLVGETSTITQKTFNEYLTLAASIDSDEKVSVQFPVSGKIAKVFVFEGSNVKKNQLLATLDSRSVQKDLEKSLNTFLTSRWDFDQNKADYKPSEAPGTLGDKWQRIIDKAQFGLNNTILDVELRSLAIESSQLRTPISGVVTKISAPIAGVQVSPPESRIEIVNPNTLLLVSDVDQNDLKNLAVGMYGQATLDAFSDKNFDVVIRQISFAPKENEISALYKVKIDFDRSIDFSDQRLGMTGDIRFLLKEKQIEKALLNKFVEKTGNEYFIYLVNGKTVKKTPVRIGQINDGYTEILADVPPNSVVVLPPKK